MCKKLIIVIKTLGWRGVSNTSKIPWYLANHDIQNRFFYMLVKHLSEKSTMIFFNIMILSKNFKNTFFNPHHVKTFGYIVDLLKFQQYKRM
jgi:hypothetical protein